MKERISSQRMPCKLYLLRNASQFIPSYSWKKKTHQLDRSTTKPSPDTLIGLNSVNMVYRGEA